MKPVLVLLTLCYLLKACIAWDQSELEIFDLVEEVNANFYDVLGISPVCIFLISNRKEYFLFISVTKFHCLSNYLRLSRIAAKMRSGKLTEDSHLCCTLTKMMHQMQRKNFVN